MDLYGRRNSSNVLPVLWCLEEIGVPYRRIDVGGQFGGNDTAAFRALNPNGRVPVLDDAGFVLWESNAIVRYLAEVHGGAVLRPPDVRSRATGDQWMEWYKTTFYPPFIALFQMFIRTEPARREPDRIAALAETVGDLLRIPDAVLQRQAHLGGDAFGIGDIPLGVALYRYMELPIARPDLPGLGRWYAALGRRPAYRRVVMRPFGLTPDAFKALELQSGGDQSGVD